MVTVQSIPSGQVLAGSKTSANSGYGRSTASFYSHLPSDKGLPLSHTHAALLNSTAVPSPRKSWSLGWKIIRSAMKRDRAPSRRRFIPGYHKPTAKLGPSRPASTKDHGHQRIFGSGLHTHLAVARRKRRRKLR